MSLNAIEWMKCSVLMIIMDEMPWSMRNRQVCTAKKSNPNNLFSTSNWHEHNSSEILSFVLMKSALAYIQQNIQMNNELSSRGSKIRKEKLMLGLTRIRTRSKFGGKKSSKLTIFVRIVFVSSSSINTNGIVYNRLVIRAMNHLSFSIFQIKLNSMTSNARNYF